MARQRSRSCWFSERGVARAVLTFSIRWHERIDTSPGRPFGRGGSVRARATGAPGGSGAAPIDLTQKWEDVVSRYEMLWQQHYGTSDATWEQMAPVYRFAWRTANAPHYRGRPWAEVETTVRHEWESLALGSDSAASQTRASAAGRAPQSRREDAGTASARPPWSDVAGPIRGVREDVGGDGT